MIIAISKNGTKGTVEYDTFAHSVSIDFDGPHADLDLYFNKPREFKIPVSQKIDDYETHTARPIATAEYFKLSLCSVLAETGFAVQWGSIR